MASPSTAGAAADFLPVAQALGLHLLERGWLSSNNVVLVGAEAADVVDTGYATHAPQTVALAAQAIGERPLRHIVNTHLHSDHCGGNAALQAHFADASIVIPPGQADAVARWDAVALTHETTGQQCPRFSAQRVLHPGESIVLGDWRWEALAARGHDPHSLILLQPDHGVLLSADALWENGFGIVFPELEGIDAFSEVAETLDLIEQLSPRWVIPGHGRAFADLPDALARARRRLAQFQQHPERHRWHALKVLVKFKLLEWQRAPEEQLVAWFLKTPYFGLVASPGEDRTELLTRVVNDLVQSGALARHGGDIVNA